jgi:hypothetical protein
VPPLFLSYTDITFEIPPLVQINYFGGTLGAPSRTSLGPSEAVFHLAENSSRFTLISCCA